MGVVPGHPYYCVSHQIPDDERVHVEIFQPARESVSERMQRHIPHPELVTEEADPSSDASGAIPPTESLQSLANL